MIRAVSVLLASLMLSGASLAAGKPQPSFKPQSLPTLQQSEADIGTLSAPAAPMMQPKAKAPAAMAPQKMIEGLGAIKGSRDGTQTTIEAPARVKNMLMGKQSGLIGGAANKGELKRIVNTAEYPYTTMGVVASGCTGTVVMQRFVLTAAWCVFDLQNKKFYENLNFFPAMDGKKTPFGEVAWKNVWVAKGFAESGDLNFGYGLIELEQPIGDQTGWFGFGDLPKTNPKLTLTGYPFAGVPALSMWESRCTTDAAEENHLFYRCPGKGPSLATMMGSPIWFKGKADDAWQIVGIHVAAQNDKQNSWWAARLNAAHTETLLAWANAANEKDTGTEEDIEQDTDKVVDEDDPNLGDIDEEDVAGTDQGTECTCDQ
jgi:V8-like Glu-specific endopeptidase